MFSHLHNWGFESNLSKVTRVVMKTQNPHLSDYKSYALNHSAILLLRPHPLIWCLKRSENSWLLANLSALWFSGFQLHGSVCPQKDLASSACHMLGAWQIKSSLNGNMFLALKHIAWSQPQGSLLLSQPVTSGILAFLFLLLPFRDLQPRTIMHGWSRCT